MDCGSFASLVNLLVSRVQPGIANIVQDGVVEQDGLLGDNANLSTQAVKINMRDVLAINADAPLGHVVESIEQLQDSALTGPGFSNKTGEQSRVNFKP